MYIGMLFDLHCAMYGNHFLFALMTSLSQGGSRSSRLTFYLTTPFTTSIAPPTSGSRSGLDERHAHLCHAHGDVPPTAVT